MILNYTYISKTLIFLGNKKLALWASDHRIMIWNFDLRLHAMDQFKRTLFEFIEMNQSSFSAPNQILAEENENMDLEGVEVVYDSAERFTSALLTKEHFHSMEFSETVVKFFVACGKNDCLYVVCNLNSSLEPTSSVVYRTLDTEDILRCHGGFALYAGELVGIGPAVVVYAASISKLLVTDLDTGAPLRVFATATKDLSSSVLCSNSNHAFLIFSQEPTIKYINLSAATVIKAAENSDGFNSFNLEYIVENPQSLFFGLGDDGNVLDLTCLTESRPLLASSHESGKVPLTEIHLNI